MAHRIILALLLSTAAAFAPALALALAGSAAGQPLWELRPTYGNDGPTVCEIVDGGTCVTDGSGR